MGAVAANSWQHVVVTRDAATKTIRFYVNGIARGTGSYSGTPAASTKGVSVGRSDAGTQYVNGRLDEVAIYPATLGAVANCGPLRAAGVRRQQHSCRAPAPGQRPGW